MVLRNKTLEQAKTHHDRLQLDGDSLANVGSNGDFAAGESITGGAGADIIALTNATTINFTTGTLATVETLTGSAQGYIGTTPYVRLGNWPFILFSIGMLGLLWGRKKK